MKKRDVRLGISYAVLVSGRIVPVRIDEEHARKGWMGTNMRTGCRVHIRTAARLRWATRETEA